jgi:hypothetical protein
MGILGTHPAVFVRETNKGLTGYGTWKSVRKMGGSGKRKGGVARIENVLA